MPVQHRFPASGPLTLDVRLHRGAVHVTAVDTDEVTVDITGRGAAEAMRVELTGKHLVIAPVHRVGRHHLDVVVRLPAGSEVRIAAASADVTVEGAVATATVSCASGRVEVAEVDGRAELQSASGAVRVGTVHGPLDLRSASGSLEVDRVTGDCTARSASGPITIGGADGDVTARSASGRIRVREAHRGTVDVHSTSGSVEVGVRRGTLVWLDVASTCGRVSSDLAGDEAGDGAALTLRARTVSGSVSVTAAGPTAIAL
jgi:DUF4097 and DUF4098 domain-containing protein YvlB